MPSATYTLTYQWYLNNRTISGAGDITYVTSQIGSYTVLLIDYLGCTSLSAPAVISNYPLPDAAITAAGPLAFCLGGSVNLNANTGTGLSYQWYNSGAKINGATLTTFNAVVSGSYTVVVSSNSPCKNAQNTSNSIVVTVSTPPNAGTPSVSSNTSCNTPLTMNAVTGAGYSYQWLNSGVDIANATVSNYTATVTGNYSVIVTSNNSCSATSNVVSLTIYPLPDATVSPQGPTSFCQGGSVSLNTNPVAGETYQWYQQGSGKIANATTSSYSAIQSGSFYVIIIDNHGCTATSSNTTVTVSPVPAPAVTSPVTYCQNVTASALSATGSSLLWYTSATGGTGSSSAPVPSTTSPGTTDYYVSQTVNTCESPRAMISVIVNAAPLLQLLQVRLLIVRIQLL